MENNNFTITRLNSYENFKDYMSGMSLEYEKREQYERSLISDPKSFTAGGSCYLCRQKVHFLFDYLHAYPIKEILTPNWRERLVCPMCFLNNRMRAAIHLFEHFFKPNKSDSAIYIAEQVTPLYQWFARNYANVTGSEYFGEMIPFGTDRHGIRNEDLTRLSFADHIFDFVLTFDMFEKIPDFQTAFHECLRVLKPDGCLFFTVPFDKNSEKNKIHAEVKDDETEGSIQPTFHPGPGNPDRSCPVFTTFGWEILGQLKEAGFFDASAFFYWSDEFGYLGDDQIVFIAQKMS